MPARLISLDYLVPQCDTSLIEFPVLIGRAADAHLRLDDRSVSNHHCEIDEIDGRMVVRDLDSLRGTFVNGARIRESELRPGDQLAIGMLTFLVQGVAESKKRARASHAQAARQRRQKASLVLAAT